MKELNKNQLLERIKVSKKIDYNQCINEEFKRKEYFDKLKLDEIRKRFRISSSMVEHVRGNFSSKYRGNSLACQACLKVNKEEKRMMDTTRDSQNHILYRCPAYDDLRLVHNVDTDIGIVQYFTAVIERRVEEGEV